MKVITKVLIFIGLLTAVACIAGAFLHTYRKESSDEVQLSTESTQKNSSSLSINSTQSPQALPTEPSLEPDQDIKPKRAKRAIIFRPLFVYRQQQIKKQHYQAMREQQQQTTTTTTQKPKYASGYSYGSSYSSSRYPSYYYPYYMMG